MVSPSVSFWPSVASHVALRLGAEGSLVEHVPVRRRHDHSRAVMFLQEPRAAIVIGMSMAHDCVFDVGRIQTQLLHSAGYLVFDRIVKDGVQNNDAFRCCDGSTRRIPDCPKK